MWAPACLLVFAAILGVADGVAAQGLAPAPPAFQHITVVASTSQAAAPGGAAVTLWVDVTPRVGVHVYGVNPAQVFTPVRLVLTPNSALTPGRVVLPPPEMAQTLGVTELVAVYRKTFRIAQPVTIAASARSGEIIRIAGAVNYQACDERLCYPSASVPVSWTVSVK